MIPRKFHSLVTCVIRAVTVIYLLATVSIPFASASDVPPSPTTLRVVMDDSYPPYAFKNEQGQLQGIIVDQWRLWEKKTGIRVDITGTDWAEAQRRMLAGEFDVIDTIFRNEKREGNYDFTKPYAQLDVPLFFHEEISGIRGPEDLKGFHVAVKSGDNSIDILKKSGVTSIAEYPSYEKLIEAARDGKVKVFTVDRPPALYFLNKMGIQHRFRETKPIYQGEFHRAVLKGRTGILAVVENGFNAIPKEDYEAVNKQWMGASIALNPYVRFTLYCIGIIAVLALAGLCGTIFVAGRDKKITATTLFEKERHFRSYFDRAMVGMAATSPGKGWLEVNPALCEMLGYSAEELQQKTWADLTHPDDLAADVTQFNRLLAGDIDDYSMEKRFICKNGVVVWSIMAVQAVRNPDKSINYCVAILQDITERKLAEKNLRNLYRTQTLKSSITQTIVHMPKPQELFDAVCRIAVYQGGFRMAWIGLLNLQTRHVSAMAHAGEIDDYLDKLNIDLDDKVRGLGPTATSLKTGKYCVVNNIASDPRIAPWRADALRMGYQASANFPFIVAGEVRGCLTLYADEPDFFIGDELELLNELAADITFALEFIEIEEKRRLAEEELKKKNADMEQFIYTVSHDLRTPLVTIKTFMGHLENDMVGGDRERVVQDIQYIHSAADKMKLLLNELLEMSRVDRVETPHAKVSLKEVLSEVLATMAGVISDRKVDIRLPDTDLALFGNRQRFCQIWQNLIENSIKYSRDNSIPRIELGVRQLNGEEIFFVKDEGIGINSQYHRKIFGIFDKLDPKSPGAGMGLSMVQKIVDKCGGRIWVESEGNDKGSCFFFTLPQAVVRSGSTSESLTNPWTAAL